MNEDEREKIKARIAHLMAMGNDPRTNQFEAEAALRQAMKLMRMHAIEQAELADATTSKPVWDWYSVVVPADPITFVKSALSWLGALAVGVAKFTDTKVTWSSNPEYGMCIRIDGEFSDVQFAAWLLKNLRDHVRYDSMAFRGRRADRELFRRAMVHRLSVRMEELRAEQDRAETDGRALVFIDKKIVARNEKFGTPEYANRSNKTSSTNYSAAMAGIDAGNRVGLGRPIGRDAPAMHRALEN